jgi:hypothetical protein
MVWRWLIFLFFFFFFFISEHVKNHFDLSVNTSIDFIRIELPEFYPFGPVAGQGPAICQGLASCALLLSQIKSASLCQVVLSEGPETDAGVFDQALPELVSVLKGRQFARVQRVVFPGLDGLSYGAVKEYLKTELSEWDRNGVLTFLDEWENDNSDFSIQACGPFDI